MKKYLSLFIVLVLAFGVSVNNSYAREGDVGSDDGLTPTQKIESEKARDVLKGKIEDRKENIGELKDKRAEIKTNIEATREDFKAKREEAKQKMSDLREKLKGEKDRVKAKIKEARITGREKALARFDGAITRLNILKNRINAQIAKLEVKGVNVTDAKNFMATAQTKLDAADAKMAEINALLAVSIDQLSADNKTKLRTLAQDTQTLLKDAHDAMKDAVKSLKKQVKIKIDTRVDTNTSTSTEVN